MNVRATLCLALIVGLVFCTSHLGASDLLPGASVLAYTNRKPPTISSIGLWGTIQSVPANGSSLKIKAGTSAKAKKQKNWTVVPQSDTQVTIEGTATLDYLRKGTLVEFTGSVVNDDQLDGALKELTVVDKKTSDAPGGPKKDRATDPGVGNRIVSKLDDAAAAADDSEHSTANAPADGSKPALGTGKQSTIVGKIVNREDKKLTVASGRRLIKLELTDVPTIKIRLSDPKLVQTGAKIEVHGTGAQSKQGNEVSAKTIVITLPDPLTGSKSTASNNTSKKAAGQ